MFVASDEGDEAMDGTVDYKYGLAHNHRLLGAITEVGSTPGTWYSKGRVRVGARVRVRVKHRLLGGVLIYIRNIINTASTTVEVLVRIRDTDTKDSHLLLPRRQPSKFGFVTPPARFLLPINYYHRTLSK